MWNSASEKLLNALNDNLHSFPVNCVLLNCIRSFPNQHLAANQSSIQSSLLKVDELI